MSKKELERKIAKTLRKANRLKSPKLQLERVNELLATLQGLQARSLNGARKLLNGGTPQAEYLSHERLSLYIELCQMHKLKFQMDGLLQSVKEEVKKLEQRPDSLTLDAFDRLLKRLSIVREIDPAHDEARELINLLMESYPELAEKSRCRNLFVDVTPYQAANLTIEIEIPLKEMTDHEQLRALYKPYQITAREPHDDETGMISQLRFSLKYLKDFELFHEELHTKAAYRITVNNMPLEEKVFSAWFLCYKRFLKANTPQYCYGASPFSLNVFGCHKLEMPDVAKEIDRCWFHYGELDQDTGIFIVAVEQIAHWLRQRLYTCGFCPAFTEEKVSVGLALIPRYINPECDARWGYLMRNGARAGVIPPGHDVAVSLTPLTADMSALPPLIEVSSTPSVNKAMQYLISRNLQELQDPGYKRLSHCISCGAPYRAHAMICSKCKEEFWKLALKDIETVIRSARQTREIALPAPQAKSPQPAIRPDAPVAALPRIEIEPEVILLEPSEGAPLPVGIPMKKPQPPLTPPAPPKKKTEPVSFDALWQDPNVQALLSPPPAPAKEETMPSAPLPPVIVLPAPVAEPITPPPAREERPMATPPVPDPRPAAEPEEEFSAKRQRPASSGRLDLHEKLRGLMSKKYRERKAIEHAFAEPEDFAAPEEEPAVEDVPIYTRSVADVQADESNGRANEEAEASGAPPVSQVDDELLNAIKQYRPRPKSDLKKRGVVRIIYHGSMDADTCPLCAYLDGMVMDPSDPAADIFSPPLFPGCTCRREYVLKTEKPSNWPEVTFRFPPKELLEYLGK